MPWHDTVLPAFDIVSNFRQYFVFLIYFPLKPGLGMIDKEGAHSWGAEDIPALFHEHKSVFYL